MALVSNHPWVTAPKHLCLWTGSELLMSYHYTRSQSIYSGRQLVVEVDHRGLDSGVHYSEVYIIYAHCSLSVLILR